MGEARLMGNCLLLKQGRQLESVGIIDILGIKTRPFFNPTASSASIKCGINFVTISFVPLLSPAEEFRLRMSLIGHPIFNLMLCAGKPEVSIEFKNLLESLMYFIPVPLHQHSNIQ